MSIKVLEPQKKKASVGKVAPMIPRWISQSSQAEQAAVSEDAQAVWIIGKPHLTDRVVRNICWPSHRVGYIVLIGAPRPEVLPALEGKFARVAFVNVGGVLEKEELKTVLKSPQRRDRFVGGIVDQGAMIVTLWRGSLEAMVVPFTAFPATANGIGPDWKQFGVADYGHTLRFGEYEAATDSILYDYDPGFRRRQNQLRKATERTFGASIRRLRRQRQLTRTDFEGLDPKTLARIERSEVAKPHQHTLKLIADRLGVNPDELGTY